MDLSDDFNNEPIIGREYATDCNGTVVQIDVLEFADFDNFHEIDLTGTDSIDSDFSEQSIEPTVMPTVEPTVEPTIGSTIGSMIGSTVESTFTETEKGNMNILDLSIVEIDEQLKKSGDRSVPSKSPHQSDRFQASYEHDDIFMSPSQEIIPMHTEKMEYGSHYRGKHKNSHWCDYCYCGKFAHTTSLNVFIEKCIEKFEKSEKRFVQSREAQMLRTIISLEPQCKNYLIARNITLYNTFDIAKYSSDSYGYVVGGIVDQYVEREYSIRTTHNRNMGQDFDKWLIQNNEKCAMCNCLACPFHKKFGSFEIIDYEGNKIFCCGWCYDTLPKIHDSMSDISFDAEMDRRFNQILMICPDQYKQSETNCLEYDDAGKDT
jgi:hypothetical protein